MILHASDKMFFSFVFFVQSVTEAVDRLVSGMFARLRPRVCVDLLPALSRLRTPATAELLADISTHTHTHTHSWRMVPFAAIELEAIQGKETHVFDVPLSSSVKLAQLQIPLDWLVPEVTLVSLAHVKTREVQYEARSKIAERCVIVTCHTNHTYA